MTIADLYTWAAKHDCTDYILVTENGYEIWKKDLKVKDSPNEELMKGEVWISSSSS